MFLIKCRPLGVIYMKSIKCFSVSAFHNKSKNHYESLGLTPNATQADIKSAYYKLSMQYHPDKNRGSENAAEIFRDITTAYEVLGNLKLRKLYDKGILYTAGPQYAPQEEDMQMEDDSQRKFYKSREHRTRAPPSSGRNSIYNFDEWTQAHYGSSFARREAAKARYERKINLEFSNKDTLGKEIFFFLSIAFFTVIALFYVRNVSYDVAENTAENNKKDVRNSIPQKM